MDELHLAEFVGLPSALGWSRVISLATTDADQACFICLAIAGSDAAAVGHEVVAILKASRVDSEETLYERISDLNNLVIERNAHLSAAAALVSGSRGCWVICDGVVALRRRGKFGRLLAAANLEIRAGSLQPGDIFVLATSAAGGMLDDVGSLFEQGYQLAGVESSLERLIRTQPRQDVSAVALLATGEPADSSSENGTRMPLHSLEEIATVTIDQSLTNRDKLQSDETVTSVYPSVEYLVQQPVGSSSMTATSPVAQRPAIDAKKRRIQMASLAGWGKRLGVVISRALIKIVTWAQSASNRCVRYGKHLVVMVRSMPWRRWALNRRNQVTVAISAGLLVVCVVAWLVYSWNQQRAAAQANAALEPYQQQFAAAQTLAATDPVGSRAELATLLSEVNEAAGTANGGAVQAALQQLSRQIQQFEQSLIGAAELAQLPVFVDLQTVVPNFVTSLSDGLPGKAIYVDTVQKKAISLTTSSKETTLFDLGSLETITSVALRNADEAVILGKGIYILPLKADATPQQVKSEGDSNRGATLIGAYGNYVYVFNPEKRNIFRYMVRKDGYSDPIGWLLSPLGISADTVQAMKVDGDVWLGTTDGQVKKFSSGRATSFAITGADQLPEGPLELYTSENDQYLYVLVASQRRTIVVTKDGQFVKQIKSPVFAGAVAVMADEASSRLYPISGSVVYEAPF